MPEKLLEIEELIELYRGEECLWNVVHNHYANVENRMVALHLVSPVLGFTYCLRVDVLFIFEVLAI